MGEGKGAGHSQIFPSNPKCLSLETFRQVIVSLIIAHPKNLSFYPLWEMYHRCYVARFEMRKLRKCVELICQNLHVSLARVSLGSRPAFLGFQASFFHNLDHVSWQISILRLRKGIFTISSLPWCLPFVKLWLNVSESKHYLLLSNEEDKKKKIVFPPQHSVCLIADLQ